MAAEKKVQDCDTVAEVDLTIAVGVCRLVARKAVAAGEEEETAKAKAPVSAQRAAMEKVMALRPRAPE